MCFCMGWRCDGRIIGNRSGRERANENLQSNRKRYFGGKKMKPFHWVNKCGCAVLAHYAVPQQVSFTIRDFAEVHIRGSYKA